MKELSGWSLIFHQLSTWRLSMMHNSRLWKKTAANNTRHASKIWRKRHIKIFSFFIIALNILSNASLTSPGAQVQQMNPSYKPYYLSLMTSSSMRTLICGGRRLNFHNRSFQRQQQRSCSGRGTILFGRVFLDKGWMMIQNIVR